jgi:hypothetical protein
MRKEGYNMLRPGDLVQRRLRNGYVDLLLILGIARGPYDDHSGRTYYKVLCAGGDCGKMYLPDEWLVQRICGGGQDGQR